MSLTTSQIIAHVQKTHPGEWDGPKIATTVSFICGIIVFGIGILRLGWIVEFIPAPAVSGFMTGSAINIAAGQVPGLMGISGFEYVLIVLPILKLLTRCRCFQHSGCYVQSHHQHFEGSSENDSRCCLGTSRSCRSLRYSDDYGLAYEEIPSTR